MSIDKHIFDSGTSAEMFDLLHVMPEGDVKIFHELDMVLSLDQYKNLYMDDKDKQQRSSRYKRKARAGTSYRWPNCTVFYEVTEGLGLKRDRIPIDQAIAEWEEYTCLNFVENRHAPQRIVFTNGDMCASRVGMQPEPQKLTLAPGCKTKGIVAHEIGHAIGWYHEHMRPDRDEYIAVDLTGVPERFHSNFKKYNSRAINTYNVGYSYLSLMHYGADIFRNSIKTRDPKFQDRIGQRSGLSFKDIKLANVMYDCAKTMGCKRNFCGNGFQFYKNFKGKGKCQCVCDSGNLNDPLKICSFEDKFRVTTPVPTPPTVATTTLSPANPDKKCEDMRSDCFERKGECMKKMATMMTHCPRMCGFCGKGEDMCMDWEYSCGAMTAFCNMPGLEETMTSTCRASCGKCAKPPPDPCEMYLEMTGEDEYDLNSAVMLGGVWAMLSVAMVRLILTF